MVQTAASDNNLLLHHTPTYLVDIYIAIICKKYAFKCILSRIYKLCLTITYLLIITEFSPLFITVYAIIKGKHIIAVLQLIEI